MGKPRPLGRRSLALTRWLMTLFGGILLGVGILLYGQAQLVHHIRHEVDSTFFLLRWVGKVSFVFMDVGTQVPLALAQIPPESVRESERWAYGMLILGGCVTLVSLFLRSPKRAGKGRR